MEDWKSPLSAKVPQSLFQRILHRLMLKLLVQFLRLAGWGAVIGLPAMILGPRRCGGLVKRFPIATGSACLAMLICVALWSDSLHSKPTEFEIESIDHFDDPVELLAETNAGDVTESFDASDPLLRQHVAAANTKNVVTTRKYVAAKEEVVTTGGSFGRGSTADDTTVDTANRVVWLTGDIEDLSPNGPAGPVRNATRIPSNRQ